MRKRYALSHKRAVCWLVAVFVFSQVCISIIVDQFAPRVRDPEYAQLEELVQARSTEQPELPLAIFVGSSRVVHGFDASRAAGDESVVLFNFGIPGSGPYFQSVMLDRLHASGVRPDILFLEVLLPFFNAAGPIALDQGLLDGARLSASEAADLFSYGSRSRTGPIRRWVYARLLPGYRHQAEIRDRLGLGIYPLCGVESNFDAQGYRPKKVDSVDLVELTRQAHSSYDSFYPDFQLDLGAWSRLVAMIQQAQCQGTQVAVVLMPEGSEFRSLYTPASRIECESLLARLRSEIGVAVVDARDWLDDAAFYDQHHLTPAGAQAFSTRFRMEALRPVLDRREKDE